MRRKKLLRMLKRLRKLKLYRRSKMKLNKVSNSRLMLQLRSLQNSRLKKWKSFELI